MNANEARTRFAAARVARLATTTPDGRPHLVPVVFAVETATIYTAVDAKRKRTTALQRLDNVRAHPTAAVLVDHYDDQDWDALWWVRADGHARVLESTEPEAQRAVELLQQRYAQHRAVRPPGPVLAVDVEKWTGWSATPI